MNVSTVTPTMPNITIPPIEGPTVPLGPPTGSTTPLGLTILLWATIVFSIGACAWIFRPSIQTWCGTQHRRSNNAVEPPEIELKEIFREERR